MICIIKGRKKLMTFALICSLDESTLLAKSQIVCTFKSHLVHSILKAEHTIGNNYKLGLVLHMTVLVGLSLKYPSYL